MVQFSDRFVSEKTAERPGNRSIGRLPIIGQGYSFWRMGLIHKTFAVVRKVLPGWLSEPIRSVATAALTPVMFSYRTGHLRSSLKRKAVTRDGKPLLWYTYPSIEFLARRGYEGKTILEFGGGQSTLWWAARAKQVVTLDGKPDWHAHLKTIVPANVSLHLVSMETPAVNVAAVEEVLRSLPYAFYDVIIIDGLLRGDLIPTALRRMSQDGMIVCDNAESYPFYDGFKQSGLLRADFYGYAPGVILPACTCIYFRPGAFAFSAEQPIERIR